jgi:hypothetical protein
MINIVLWLTVINLVAVPVSIFLFFTREKDEDSFYDIDDLSQ